MTGSVEPLTAADVGRFGFWRTSRLGSRALARHIETYPDLCWRLGSDYLLAGRWRGRADIAEIIETVGATGRPRLLQALLDALPQAGYRAVILSLAESSRRAAEYLALGWPVLAELVFYRWPPDREPATRPPVPVRRAQATDLDTLCALDEAAFADLWRDTRAGLAAYLKTPNLDAWVAEVDGRVAGYLTANGRGGAANLDRLGAHPDYRGRGIGESLVGHALRYYRQTGRSAITLNTPADNQASRRLYGRMGFTVFGSPQPIIGRGDLHAATPARQAGRGERCSRGSRLP